MAAATYELELTWPITDPAMSLGDLKTQAAADLRATLTRRGLTQAGNAIYSVTHGATPAVTVRLLVTTPAGIRLPAHSIEATQAHEAETAEGEAA